MVRYTSSISSTAPNVSLRMLWVLAVTVDIWSVWPLSSNRLTIHIETRAEGLFTGSPVTAGDLVNSASDDVADVIDVTLSVAIRVSATLIILTIELTRRALQPVQVASADLGISK